MTLVQAAQTLSQILQIPSSAVSIIEWHEDGNLPSLRVWVDARYLQYARNTLPRNLEGFAITVEQRPTLSAG